MMKAGTQRGALALLCTAVLALAAGDGDRQFQGICSGLYEGQCLAQSNCSWVACPDCSGDTSDGECYLKGNEPDIACPAIDCAPPPCELLDEASCEANPACVASYCSDCQGGQDFQGCYQATDAPLDCGAVCPVPGCLGLDQASCESSDGCVYDACYDCDGNEIAGSGCRNEDDPPAGCPPVACPGFECDTASDEASCTAIGGCYASTCPDCDGNERFSLCLPEGVPGDCPDLVCPPPGECNGLDAAGCAQNGNCHAVYQPGMACGCATPGCCTFFSYCADGATANCSGTPACDSKPPLCEGDYVVSYSGTCYEGCVLTSECAAPPP